MDTYYTCLCCQGNYFKENHDCKSGQFCTKRSTTHFDFCPLCHKLMNAYFEAQMKRKELPAPKLRIEEDHGGT